MLDHDWVSVPLGLDSDQWVTRRSSRTVLIAVHTVVSGQRLLDVVGLVESDPRVQVAFTAAPDVFGNGVAELIRAAGALEIPWSQATHERFDLCVTAASGGIDRLHGPVLVLPHGAGHGKLTPRAGRGVPVQRTVYGLGAEHLVRSGRLVPASLALSHENQLTTLVRQCPPATEIATVVGDPCYDTLIASQGRRDEYRFACGVRPGQRLVLVASTWGPQGLFAREPQLPGRLLRELDPCRYRVVFLLHPAAWFGHSRRQIRAWLDAELGAGLVLPEPQEDWRPFVVAADHVIGDHGSTTVYAAALGRPVLHTGIPADDLDTGSPQWHVGSRAPRLDPRRPLENQLTATTALCRDEVRSLLTSFPGKAHRRLRAEMYRLMNLTVPDTPAEATAAPIPGGCGV